MIKILRYVNVDVNNIISLMSEQLGVVPLDDQVFVNLPNFGVGNNF